VRALDLKIATTDVPLRYRARPRGSQSKLRTFRDGLRILGAILLQRAQAAVVLRRDRRELDHRRLRPRPAAGRDLPGNGLVPRLPTAILATGMVQVDVLSVAMGLVLDAIARSRRYLDLKSVAEKT
jgi:hypothetical protein